MVGRWSPCRRTGDRSQQGNERTGGNLSAATRRVKPATRCQLVFYAPAGIYCRLRSRTLRVSMKADIHPQYATATVRCACGNTFVTRSTSAEIHTDICAQCHPFFTGKQKLVDTAGRVERFRQKYEKKA